MKTTEILRRPYARVLIPEEDGRFSAEISEFPGCVAFGDDASSALRALEEVALDWLGAAIAQGKDIPAPFADAEFSGKLVLRMPKGLHRRAAACAEKEGVSLNAFISTSLAQAVGRRSAAPVAIEPLDRAARGAKRVSARA